MRLSYIHHASSALLFLYSNLVNALDITILNKCPWAMDIYNHIPSTRRWDHVCKRMPSGAECKFSIPEDRWDSGLIKNLLTEQATLFEFSKNKQGVWYDISVIPPGSGNCFSWEDCFNKSKKRGFNDALNVLVDQRNIRQNSRCKNLFCRNERCQDAYLFPYDDTKTHFCELGVKFRLEYC